jgi:GNAT superfamily N-acetyltransferase
MKSAPKIRRSHPIEVRDVAPRDWPLLERLFGANGACGGCWCMHWRVRGVKNWERSKGAGNRRAFRKLVESGEARGCIAIAEGEPVGWCSLGPKAGFARLSASRVLDTGAREGTWSVVCFFIPAAWRGRGVATKLLEGAVRQARRLGARRLEGYPVAVAEGERYPSTFAFVGVPALFENAGFTALDGRTGARPIFVRELRAAR